MSASSSNRPGMVLPIVLVLLLLAALAAYGPCAETLTFLQTEGAAPAAAARTAWYDALPAHIAAAHPDDPRGRGTFQGTPYRFERDRTTARTCTVTHLDARADEGPHCPVRRTRRVTHHLFRITLRHTD